MNAPQGMIERGIMNAKAEYMIHFFPLMREVSWYRTDHARSFILRYNPLHHIFNSKDGTPTGAGYLINKNTYFVSSATVPEVYCTTLLWESLTNRESGFAGEEIVEVLMEHRIILIPSRRAVCVREREAQFASVDAKVIWLEPTTYEVKTEVLCSPSLCLQTHEGQHRVHLANQDGRIVKRVTAAPSLDDDIPF